MSTKNERKTSASWGCLSVILIAAFFMTLGQTMMGGHWGWPLVFGALLFYIMAKLGKDAKKREAADKQP